MPGNVIDGKPTKVLLVPYNRKKSLGLNTKDLT